MLLWPILFIAFALAEDSSVEEFCFPSPGRMEQVSLKSKIILIPSDEISKSDSCLTIKTKSHRRELIQNYIRNLDSSVRISFSSAEVRRSMCELKVERLKDSDLQNRNVVLNQNSVISVSESKSDAQNVSQIKTLGDFELTFNQDIIKGNCRYITPVRYEISLEVRKDPKPLYPGLPTGSIVVISNPTPPPDQETSRLNTTVQLDKGGRIEVGSIIRNLKNEKNKIENTPEASHQNEKVSEQEKIYLSIE